MTDFNPGDLFDPLPEDEPLHDSTVRPTRDKPKREWKGPKPHALPVLTGVDWPPRQGQDPRLLELLTVLRPRLDGDHDPKELLWVICASVWWLEPAEARRVGAIIGESLRTRSVPGESGAETGSPSRAA
jgi:hypothetical protein